MSLHLRKVIKISIPRQWKNLGQHPAGSRAFLSHKPINTREETTVLKGFREDWSHVILTAGNGVAMVVLDKHDYIDMAEDLLGQSDTYKTLSLEPINKQ